MYIHMYIHVWNYLNSGHVLPLFMKYTLIYTVHVLLPQEFTSTANTYVMYRSDGAANVYTLCIGAMVQQMYICYV